MNNSHEPTPLARTQFLFGMSGGQLVRLLWRHRFRVLPRYARHLGQLLAFAPVESLGGRRLPRVARFTDPCVFIVGHWRSGTTLLQRVLHAGLDKQSLSLIEAMLPTTRPRLRRRLHEHIQPLLPATRGFDSQPMGLDEMTEDEFALIHLGAISPMLATVFPADADQYDPAAVTADADRTALHLARLATLLGESGRGWLFKSPSHAFRIPQLAARFPNARFIDIRRHPASESRRSTRHVIRHLLRNNALQHPGRLDVATWVADYHRAHAGAVDMHFSHLPDNRHATLSLEQLLERPTDTLARLWQELELDGWAHRRTAMLDALASAPGERRQWTPH